MYKGVGNLSKDMTKGGIWNHLISFAIPLVLGNIFQLTYNAVDSIIVGRFLGKNSLAAVGVANPIMNIVIFFIVGICLGASVLMSEYYGAGSIEKLKREVSTSIIAGFIFTVLLMITSIIMVKPILKLINTPEAIMVDATNYLRVIFLGLIFTFLYNILAAILRSMGDSKTPLLFLVIASVLNIIMDIIFVIVLKDGIIGVATATVVAEGISSVLCIIYICKKVPALHFKRNEIVFDKALLKVTVSYGWVTAMQQCCLYMGKFLIQGAVNPLGVESIACFNAVTKVDDFVFTPQQSISSAMTTFLAQNRGASQRERMKKGFNCGLILECIYAFFILTVIFLGAPYIMKLFISKENIKVITLGVTYLRYMSFFYIMPGVTNGIQGYFRGMGLLKITLRSTFVQMLGRVSFSYILIPFLGISGIALSCFAGWVCMLSYEVPLLFKDLRKQGFMRKSLTKQEEAM